MPPLDQIVGPVGALVLAVVALSALARDHAANDRIRRQEYHANVEFERTRTASAEARLDAFRDVIKENINVTERAVALAEQAARSRTSRNGGS